MVSEQHVLLIGGSGFVGRHLAPRLRQSGWSVQIASRHPDKEFLPAAMGRTTAVVADVRDEEQVRSAVAGADAVINLVGIVREQKQSFAAVHVEGAARIARLAIEAGVRRLLHFSALGVAEDAPAAADRTKARGEAAVRAAFPGAMLVRPSLIYGSGDHFFSHFATMARSSPALPVIGAGRTRFQPIHIEDAVRTLAAVLHRPEAVGSTLALVGPEIFTFRELLQRMLAALGLRRLILPIPFLLAEQLARGFAWLPNPPLTREDGRLLRTDKVAGDLPTPASFGIAARSLQDGLAASLRVPR